MFYIEVDQKNEKEKKLIYLRKNNSQEKSEKKNAVLCLKLQYSTLPMKKNCTECRGKLLVARVILSHLLLRNI